MADDLPIFRKTVREYSHNEFSLDQSRLREQHQPEVKVRRTAGAADFLLTDIPEKYCGGEGSTCIREPMKL
jgi:hypothetical protein